MLRGSLTRFPIALLFAGSWLGSAACGQVSHPGEVILLVTTDLAIPADASTLHITVTRKGEAKAYLNESYSLRAPPAAGDAIPADDTVSLPGTYALLSSAKTSGTLQVHLELRQGSENGIVRVERDAELEIPSEGVKQLPMPLDFSCATGNLRDACPPGTTCQAGLCVDQKLPLVEYAPTAPSTCFDVATCFRVASNIAPTDDPTLGCIIKNAGRGVDVNVALIVAAATVGNYGMCGALSGQCLVPLDHGPGGWQALYAPNNQAIAISLPEEVCTAFHSSPASIEGVAVAGPDCAPKSASAGLCSEPEGCIPAREICPSGWQGYSCSGTALVEDYSGSAPFCRKAGTDETLGPVTPGLWCCGGGYTPETNPLLIDDMSLGPQIRIKPPPETDTEPGVQAGTWWAGVDDINAVISPPAYPALFTQRPIEPPATPVGGPKISQAACLRSDGFSGYFAGEGFNFLETTPVYHVLPYDVSQHTGISFWAWSAPSKIPGLGTKIRVNFPNVDTNDQATDSTCVKNRQRCDHFGEVVALPDTPDWKLYTVKWTDRAFAQSMQDYGYEHFESFNKQVYTTQFAILGPGPKSSSLPFDFCIAQIEFTDD